MTNFSELKKQNPLSFRLFEQWVEQNYETTLNIWNGTIRNEDVLLWLDSRELYIDIDPVGHSDFQLKYFRYCILGLVDYVGRYFNRIEATENAIKKAFELLENKLKQN